jgi:hypothetical protein
VVEILVCFHFIRFLIENGFQAPSCALKLAENSANNGHKFHYANYRQKQERIKNEKGYAGKMRDLEFNKKFSKVVCDNANCRFDSKTTHASRTWCLNIAKCLVISWSLKFGIEAGTDSQMSFLFFLFHPSKCPLSPF